MVQTIEAPLIIFGPGVEASKDLKKLKAYLNAVVPMVKETELIEVLPSKEWKFFYARTKNPVTYKDAAGTSHECTFQDALKWYKDNRPLSNLPLTTNITPDPTIADLQSEKDKLTAVVSSKEAEIDRLNALLRVKEEELEEKPLSEKIHTRLLYGIVLTMLILLILAGWWIAYLLGVSTMVSQLNTDQKNTITQLIQKQSSVPFGKNEWQTIQSQASVDTQNHVLVGTILTSPLLVTGHDLELSWIYEGKTYQVKNRTYEYGVVIIPQGAQITLLNIRGPGMKASITPDVRPGITYLLGNHPPGFVEDHSGVIWPLQM